MLFARAAIFALLVSVAASPASAQGAGSAARPFPTVTVTGEGVVPAVPDIAHIVAGVNTEAKSPKEAADSNARAMTAVLAAARQAGIAENDIRTTGLSIYPIHAQRARGEGGPQITGYRVVNQARLTLREIARMPETIEKLVSAGANNMGGVQFTLSNRSRLLDMARKEAVEDARRKAGLYATAANAQLGRVLSITEQGATVPAPRMFQAAEGGAAGAPPPIAPGEEMLRVQISVTFELMH